MIKKKLIIFMPSIEIGGVEKNLYLISNFLAEKISDVSLITSDNNKKNYFKKIRIITPKKFILLNKYRTMKYFLCLFELLKQILNLNIIVFI